MLIAICCIFAGRAAHPTDTCESRCLQSDHAAEEVSPRPLSRQDCDLCAKVSPSQFRPKNVGVAKMWSRVRHSFDQITQMPAPVAALGRSEAGIPVRRGAPCSDYRHIGRYQIKHFQLVARRKSLRI
jgi:hypothetical protein